MTRAAAIGDTIGAALAEAASRLAAAGVEAPRRDARLLLMHAAALDDAAVLGYPERVLAPGALQPFAALVARRAAREPVSRILGRREFWSRDFALAPDTLDPRPDSETVIEAALARIADRGAALRVLDLGTGTGCLLLALLGELANATGVGVDLLPGAAAMARRNAASLGLEDRAVFVAGCWGEALAQAFDIVLANPPYVPSGAIAGLAPEVAWFEPRAALDGGADGLDAVRALAAALPRLLAPGGFAAIEIAAGQAAAARQIFTKAGLDAAGFRCDLNGVERCLVLERPKKTVGIRERPV